MLPGSERGRQVEPLPGLAWSRDRHKFVRAVSQFSAGEGGGQNTVIPTLVQAASDVTLDDEGGFRLKVDDGQRGWRGDGVE